MSGGARSSDALGYAITCNDAIKLVRSSRAAGDVLPGVENFRFLRAYHAPFVVSNMAEKGNCYDADSECLKLIVCD